jgi:RNA polymerase sigma factor (sigma-70 family)
MLFDANETQDQIAQVVNSITHDPHLRQDLLQEARIQFWKKESELPDHTLSYFLRGCEFRVRDYRRRGRSLDSPSRSHLRATLPDENDTEESLPGEFVSRESPSDLAAERDSLRVLAEKLDEMNRKILLLTAIGSGIREISRELHISHPAVLKRFRTIRLTATSLGLYP